MSLTLRPIAYQEYEAIFIETGKSDDFPKTVDPSAIAPITITGTSVVDCLEKLHTLMLHHGNLRTKNS